MLMRVDTCHFHTVSFWRVLYSSRPRRRRRNVSKNLLDWRPAMHQCFQLLFLSLKNGNTWIPFNFGIVGNTGAKRFCYVCGRNCKMIIFVKERMRGGLLFVQFIEMCTECISKFIICTLFAHYYAYMTYGINAGGSLKTYFAQCRNWWFFSIT